MPRARATVAEPRRGMASDAVRCVTCTCASRVVRWCRLILPLGLAKEEEEVQGRLKGSYLRVSYHPLQ
jgi:hypothetical protein